MFALKHNSLILTPQNVRFDRYYQNTLELFRMRIITVKTELLNGT